MTMKGDAMSMKEASDGVARLRWAIHPFGGPPQAQRRWVQMGHMHRSSELLEVEAGHVSAYVDAGAVTPGEARQIAEVLEAFRVVKARRGDLFYDQECGPRSFLWSTAFEEDYWTDLRGKARRTFAVLSEGKEALIASGSR
jgi:hypothetical protein